MGKAILAFLLSATVGIAVSFWFYPVGIILTISIIGAFLVYGIETKSEK